MKLLVLKNDTKIATTKSDLKRSLKKEFTDAYNRPNKLVDAYFEGNFDEKLFDRLKSLKNTNGIENLIYCFEKKDANKLVSFLTKVFDLPYFSKSLRGLTPQMFIDILVDLCTTKDGAKRKITFKRVTEKQMCSFSDRPDEYEIEVIFSTSIIDMLFQAYI